MGAYLMKPNINKESNDEDNQHLSYGASSMQGWRCEQEDAHNSILDFDLNAAFFAVYDGHGGSEVAQFCAKYLPEFLKKLDEYKAGEYEQALRQLFLKFDAYLLTPEAQTELAVLRRSDDQGMSSANGEEDEEEESSDKEQPPLLPTDNAVDEQEEEEEEAVEESEENEAAALYDEACMPLEEVLKRYTNTEDKVRRMLKKKGLVRAGPSPMINAPKSSSQKAPTTTESGLARGGRNLDTEVCSVVDQQQQQQHDFIEPQVPDFVKQEELDINEIKRNSKADVVSSSTVNPHEQDYDEASNLGDITDSQRSTSVCDQSSIQSNDTLSKSQLLGKSSSSINTESSSVTTTTTITSTTTTTVTSTVDEQVIKTTNKHILLAVEEMTNTPNPDTPSKLKMNQEEIKLSPIQKKSLNYSSIGMESSQNSTTPHVKEDEVEVEPVESTTIAKPDDEDEDEDQVTTTSTTRSSKKKMTVRELYKSDLFTKFVNSCVNAKLKEGGVKASGSSKKTEGQDDDEEDELDDDDDESDDDSEEESSLDDDDDDDDEDDQDDEEEENDDDEEDDEQPESLEEFLLQQSAKAGGYREPKPAYDSGCTAVVALLLDKKHLYVANAGDSRCVVCRKGKAVDMSVDHKPEDDLERQRIENAGGVVTKDGRVNDGLNLSRAIGDHSYKQTAGLSLSEQMITSLPDIVHLEIDPEQDEFMVLACDGIWNFMSSQEVCDYVSVRLQHARNYERLSQICEELFMHCLAPNADGDGTGCDNMTCVIITFTPFPMIVSATNGAGHSVAQALKSTTTEVEQTKQINLKRMLTESSGSGDDEAAKRRSGDNNSVSSVTNTNNAPSDRTNLVDNNSRMSSNDGETESKKLKSNDHNGFNNGNHITSE